jgi:LacI family transcriptional regulator
MTAPKRPKVAKLKDVAAAAEVSVATISRYQNNSLALPPATVERIENAIRALDYRPNPHARRLSLGRSDAIGLVLPDIANPFFAHLSAAVEQAAAAAGLEVLLSATLNSPRRELAYIERMRRNHLDGLIFVTNHADSGELARAINATGRVVLADEDVQGTLGAKVFCDNEGGGFLAGQHLTLFGHRRLAFVGGPNDLMSGVERAKGFRRAAREAQPSARIVTELFGAYGIAHGRAAAEVLLQTKPRPTGVFAASDEIAVGLLLQFKSRGFRVPADISVVGFDDVGQLDLFDPPLTTIRQPIADIGRRAVELVRDEGASATPVRLPVELIVRRSVAAPLTHEHGEEISNGQEKVPPGRRKLSQR